MSTYIFFLTTTITNTVNFFTIKKVNAPYDFPL